MIFTVSFLAYAGGSVIDGVWMGKPWASVARTALDALIYAAPSAAAFAWLRPQ